MQNTQQAIQNWFDKRKMQTQEIKTSLKSTSLLRIFLTNGQTIRTIGTDFCNPSIINTTMSLSLSCLNYFVEVLKFKKGSVTYYRQEATD